MGKEPPAVVCGNPNCRSVQVKKHCDSPSCCWIICNVCNTYGDPTKDRFVIMKGKD